jgi:type IV pilus assembly protein PilF
LAQESFERALRLAPTDPDTQHNYAWFLCQTKRYAQAQDYFMRAIANPLYSRAWKTWSAAGECALANQQTQEATRYFESALRLQPDEPVALLQLAELRYRAGIVDEARALMQRLHARNEPTAASLWLAVRIERRLQNQANQNNYADQLRRRFPSSTESQQLQRGVYD